MHTDEVGRIVVEKISLLAVQTSSAYVIWLT